MAAERVLEKTLINERVTVITMEKVEDHELVGLHAVLKTFVIGVEGIDPQTTYVAYTSNTSASIGHQQVVMEIRRWLVAINDHIHPALREGTL
ncbi:hypothetical protein [Arthrobacter sp. HMWF013]|uniref:hypothetical protein n=1 Tax=Arthrobacter sp. HMWF013 TaxID=2056849 RepID=UPI000D367BA5|nr:hypothetical protein [Arthrobacter sp. HMWF013]PTT69223.1 hypothetical protein DBR22_04435 [Arthrobacter sp. HMWF013]